MVLQRNNLSLMGVDSLYLLSLRRSIVVASASTVVMMQDCRMERLHEYVILSREHKELEVALKSTEMALLQKMETEMKPLEQVRICYELLDTDGVDGICAGELTEALRKMKDSSITGEIKTIAEMATRNHSKDGTGIIMIDELEGFLKSQQEDLQCTFSELCQLCVSKIAFSADGRAVLEEMIAQNCLDGQKDDFGSSVIRARLVLVFQMLDIQQSGRIPFRRVVKHLFRFAQSFEWDGRDVLLMMEVDDSRTLNMNEFLEFMLNFTASLPTRCALHEVTNAMTLSSCRETVSDHDIKDLFVDKAKRFDALQADDDGFEDILTLGKLHRLHRLMDRDKSGKLDQFELALGLRKFTVCRPDLQDTIEESLEAIRSVDEDGDGLLDVREFAKLLAKFANTAEVDLHRLIDFMVVQCSMECNCEEELAYIESYAKLKSDEASRRRSSFVTMALHAFWPGDNNRPTEAV